MLLRARVASATSISRGLLRRRTLLLPGSCGLARACSLKVRAHAWPLAVVPSSTPFQPSRRSSKSRAVVASVHGCLGAQPLSLRAVSSIASSGATSTGGGDPAAASEAAAPAAVHKFVHWDRYLHEVSFETLLILSSQGDDNARIELLLRDIMRVDSCDERAARDKLEEIDSICISLDFILHLPMRVGVVGAFACAVASVPLVFDYNTAKWFDKAYVLMEVPPAQETETFLEVGAWTWNWMEPLIGTASFILLCLQFARGQMINLGLKPYTEKMMRLRAQRAAKKFPTYNNKFVRDFTLVESI
eukprot:TRINITY_DN42363_c0_g1_i1.p1 TRINITY_DN42363_c0_g1~~TRINITY_DN42363_c0_g1_i1.p1  ORF type:complete len:303 (+),score=58.14 TRINITY_DN42363_c0_g1_i1:64-972(+)